MRERLLLEGRGKTIVCCIASNYFWEAAETKQNKTLHPPQPTNLCHNHIHIHCRNINRNKHSLRSLIGRPLSRFRRKWQLIRLCGCVDGFLGCRLSGGRQLVCVCVCVEEDLIEFNNCSSLGKYINGRRSTSQAINISGERANYFRCKSFHGKESEQSIQLAWI